MKILAVDTSSSYGVVSISEDEQVLGEFSITSNETHSARLLPSIDWLLKMVGLSMKDVDAFAISLGPGSFTGLRVGLSTIKGFAWSTNKPIVGMNSIEILAYQYKCSHCTIVPMIDARKGRVYAAAYQWISGISGGSGDSRKNCLDEREEQEYQDLVPLMTPVDIEVKELISQIESQKGIVCFGSGARKYCDLLFQIGGTRILLAPKDCDIPKGGTLALLAYKKFLEGNRVDSVNIEPLYLRASEAELKAKGNVFNE